jgi:hypothetical protein
VGLDVGRLVRLRVIAVVLGTRTGWPLVGLDVRALIVALALLAILLLHDRLLSRELDAHHQTAGIAGIFPRLMRIATVAT